KNKDVKNDLTQLSNYLNKFPAESTAQIISTNDMDVKAKCGEAIISQIIQNREFTENNLDVPCAPNG
ncbi:unnamed protein product, partial [Brachionus calyciflorus]